jgi:hypothetical protein
MFHEFIIQIINNPDHDDVVIFYKGIPHISDISKLPVLELSE